MGSGRVRLPRLLFCVYMMNIYRRRHTEKYISYYIVLLTGTQNWLNTHSTVLTAMYASVLTAFITQLFFFLYPETKREKALRQEKGKKRTHDHLVVCFINLLREWGFSREKKDYQLLKVSMTRLHCDVVYGGRFVIPEKRVIVDFGTICRQHDFHSLFPISYDSRNDTLSMTIL